MQEPAYAGTPGFLALVQRLNAEVRHGLLHLAFQSHLYRVVQADDKRKTSGRLTAKAASQQTLKQELQAG